MGKHYQENVDFPYGTLRKETIEPIERLGFSIEEGCLLENFLEMMAETESDLFRKIVGFLKEWRSNLIKSPTIGVE